MQLIDTRVTPSTPGMGSYSIEFIGEGGESISVMLKDDRSEAAFDIDSLIEKAKAIMIQIATVSRGTAASAGDAESGPIGQSPDRSSVPNKQYATTDEGRFEENSEPLKEQFDDRLEDNLPVRDPVSPHCKEPPR